MRLAWSRLRRVLRLIAFRPVFAVLLLGGMTLVSNALWFGTGLFLGSVPGLAITILTAAGLAAALLALAKRQCQLAALGVLIGFAVLVPAVALIAFRLKTGIPILMHDGAYQTEEAMRALLTNHDPYGFNYAQTSMQRWHWYVNADLHPYLWHYVYSPLTFLLPLPLFAAAATVGLPFDVRLVWLAAAGVAAWAIVRLPWRWEWRYVAMAVLFLDPLFYLPQGRNDILFLTALLLGCLAWERDRPVAAAWSFGLALAFKQFAVFFLPPAGLALAALAIRGRLSWRWGTAGVAGLVIPLALTTVPFLAWNPTAYWTDTVGVVTGAAHPSFPIDGFGLSALMVRLHMLPSRSATFPFGLVQAAVVLPLLAWGLPRVWRLPRLDRILQVAAITTAAALVCSRYFNDNHLAVVIFMLVLASLSRRGAVARSQAAPELARAAVMIQRMPSAWRRDVRTSTGT